MASKSADRGRPDAAHRMKFRRRRERFRAGIGIADQLIFSLTNLALTVLVARSVSANAFGAYAVATATYLLATVVLRGLTAEPLLVRYSTSDLSTWRRGATSAAGASLILGLLVGLATLTTAFAVGGLLRATLITLGVCFPGLAVQDFLRFAALALGRPMLAVTNDAAQGVVQFTLFGVLLASGETRVWLFVAAWGLGAYVGSIVGCALLQLTPQPVRAASWFRGNGDLAGRYALDDLAAQGSPQATNYVLAGVAGLSDAGALRGLQTLFGPVSILLLGVQAAMTPELVRILRRSSTRMSRHVIALAVLLGLGALAWGAIALIIPNSLGRTLFGDTWTQIQPLVGYFLIARAANAVWIGPAVGLRALAAANRTLVARLVVSVLALLFQVGGAVVDGVKGVAVATAIITPLQTLVWWWQFELAKREYRRHVAEQRTDQALEQMTDSPGSLPGWNESVT